MYLNSELLKLIQKFSEFVDTCSCELKQTLKFFAGLLPESVMLIGAFCNGRPRLKVNKNN